MNTGRGGMKRLMEEATTRHVEAVHYLTSANIRFREEKNTKMGNNARFWRVLLEGFSRKKLKKEETDRAGGTHTTGSVGAR